ncbi:MAG: YesL family protein [Bacillota bacterium]
MMERINVWCDWLLKLVLIQFYWVLFSLIGLIAFGLIPSTMAMFSVTRQLLFKKEDIPLFLTFKENFLSQFWKGTAVGAILLIASVILYVDYRFFIDHPSLSAIILVILVISFCLSMIACFLFPVYAHFEVGVWEGMKKSTFICLSHLHYGLIAWVGTGLLIILYVLFSGLLILVGGSTIAMFLTLIGQKVFKTIEKKYYSLNETNELT